MVYKVVLTNIHKIYIYIIFYHFNIKKVPFY